ncbi:MAG: hypothetical protein ACMXYE_01435 [Candidatus Woesearchaeota archaeon]
MFTKSISETHTFLRKNKARVAVCVILDIIFLIVFLATLVHYVPELSEYSASYNRIMQGLSGDEMSALEQLGERYDEVVFLQSEIQSIYASIFTILAIAFILTQTLIFAILLHAFNVKYIIRACIINCSIMILNTILFFAIVNIKSIATIFIGIDERSFLSAFVYAILLLLLHIVSIITLVTARQSSLKKWRRSWKKVFINQAPYFAFLYIISMCIIFILILVQGAFVISGGVFVFAALALIIVILLCFSYIRIFFINMIRSAE